MCGYDISSAVDHMEVIKLFHNVTWKKDSSQICLICEGEQWHLSRIAGW